MMETTKRKNVKLTMITKTFDVDRIMNETHQFGVCEIDYIDNDYKISNGDIVNDVYTSTNYVYDNSDNMIQTISTDYTKNGIKEFSEKREYDYKRRLTKISTSDGYCESRRYENIINGDVEITENNSGVNYTVIRYNSKNPSINRYDVEIMPSSDNGSEDITREIYNTENKLIFRSNSDGSSESYNYDDDGQLISMYKDDNLYIKKIYNNGLLIESIYDIDNKDGLYEKNIYTYNDSGVLLHKITIRDRGSFNEMVTVYENTENGCKITTGCVLRKNVNDEPELILPSYIKQTQIVYTDSGHISQERHIRLHESIPMILENNRLIFDNELNKYKYLGSIDDVCIINNIYTSKV